VITAVLIPCYNEERTISKVVQDFKTHLPGSKIYVYDNNSTDRTAEYAAAAGAIVKSELRRGKGNVIRSMFSDIDADIYIMVDGDDTYPAEIAASLAEEIKNYRADMVIGDRITNGAYIHENKRLFHTFGNSLVVNLINFLFSAKLKDVMSGYRAFSRKFVKNVPLLSPGFQIEVEMTLHALDKRYLIKEIPVDYRDRPPGSASKLNTISDGILILKDIFMIFKDYKPLLFFSASALLCFICGLLLGVLPVYEFIKYKYVYRVPSAIVATGFMIISLLAFAMGVILDTVARFHKQDYELRLRDYKNRQ